MEPTTTTPQQPAQPQPQWQPVTAPLTPKELTATVRAIVRDIRRVGRVAGRDVWNLGIVATVRDTRAFLKQPPRWFFYVCAALALLTIVFWTLVFTHAVATQAAWLRDQLP